MKIDPGIKPLTLPTTPDQARAQAPGVAPGATEQTNVSLSPLASQLKEMETRLAAIPVVDRAHVDRIKLAITSGEYTFNTDKIGSTLLDSVKEMLNGAK